MKITIFLLCSICSLPLPAQKPMQYVPTKASISGVVTAAADARPNARQLPLANVAFKVVDGLQYNGQLPVSTFTTDDKGNFYLELPLGSYSIVENERPETFNLKKSTATLKWDNRCRKKQWQLPLFVLRVRTMASQEVRFTKALPKEESCLKKSLQHGK